MAAPRESPGSGGVRSLAAKTALARLRGVLTNAELAECIPVELHRAGFGRVLFSQFTDNTRLLHQRPPGSCAAPVHVWQQAVGLLHVDVAHESGLHDIDADIFSLFAEGIGAIMERNIALARLHSMRVTAHAHSAEINALTSLFD